MTLPNVAETTQEPVEKKPAAATIRRRVFVRSAGKSVKGTSSEINRDYLCNIDIRDNGGSHRGLYAVADGSLSHTGGDIASETAVESFKACINRKLRDAQQDNGTKENILEY